MQTKKSFTIYNETNPNIHVGDIVHLFDGSALTLHEDHEYGEENFYILYSYSKLGFKKLLKNYDWKVIETNMTNKVASGVYNNVYLQDIIIECNGIKFRTNSTMIEK